MILTTKRLAIVLGLALLFVATPLLADGWASCETCSMEGGTYGAHPRCQYDSTVQANGFCHTYVSPCSPPYSGLCFWCEDGVPYDEHGNIGPSCTWPAAHSPNRSHVSAMLDTLSHRISVERHAALEEVIDHEMARGVDALEASESVYAQELAFTSLARAALIQMRRGIPVVRRGMVVFAAADAQSLSR